MEAGLLLSVPRETIWLHHEEKRNGDDDGRRRTTTDDNGPRLSTPRAIKVQKMKK